MELESTHKLEIISSFNNLKEAAKEVIAFSEDVSIWLFEGPMGAGKTTLIKAIGEVFNIKDNITSPTFSLVNEYQNAQGKIFYHFDFYRIKTEEEAADIGIEEYFYSGEFCFIEWPSKIPSLLPDKFVLIQIDIISETERRISLEKRG
jgi:tRNA threonylcarbamoyladenosine biosynthesis protein TsaE